MSIFITFEGPDGSGKTTQINLLKAYFAKGGLTPVITREPGGTSISEKIRGIILDKGNGEMSAVTEMLLYASARAQLVEQVIKPALERGEIVICDRFVDSSIAYQGYGRKLGKAVEIVNKIAADGIQPDLTFLLTVEPQLGKSRIENQELDRLELEKIEFHRDVYHGYMALAEQYPSRIKCIDGTKSIEEIHREIIRVVETILPSAY